jgi:hypothetical protein
MTPPGGEIPVFVQIAGRLRAYPFPMLEALTGLAGERNSPVPPATSRGLQFILRC